MNYEYFYGSQADSYSFYRIPRAIIKGPEFKGLSLAAKLLYGLLLDRMSLSRSNGWLDDKGRVFIYYTVEEIQEDLSCGHVKAGKLLAELDSKGIGLIERVRQGQGKPARIYVKQFTEANIRREESSNPRPTENGCLDSSEPAVQTSASQTSRPTENIGQELQKVDANYIDNNYTENSYTESITNQSNYEECLEEIKAQVDYPLLAEQYPYDDPESLTEMICEVMCSTERDTRIGSESIPTARVQARFRRLRFEHLAYVLDVLRESTVKIHNIKAYILRALYDAPLTIGPFYSNAVRCDSLRQ